MDKLVECVPNFSEGRDSRVIDAITAAMSDVEGVTLLDVDPGRATHRTVVTLVGPPEPVIAAAFAGIRRAAELIDMRQHTGAHARQGATDVCPLVPVRGVTVDECVALARRLAQRVGDELGIPVYLYEAAATRPERRSLADIRVGEYEALEEKLRQPEWAPDFGPAEFKPRVGATVIGVRPFLIAYNVNLSTRDARIARQIGLTIRERGRVKRDGEGRRVRDADGKLVRVPGLPHCRATGWYIEEYGRAQVTMNLTDYTVTGMHTAFDRVAAEAATMGARATGSEVVGLVPLESVLAAGRHYLAAQGATTGVSDQELVAAARLGLGLDEITPFRPEEKIIEYRVAPARPLASLTVAAFTEELGSASPAPGGGSVAALAGALGASLVAMVGALTHGKKGYRQHDALMDELGRRAHALRAVLLDAVDRDTEAFNAVMAAFRLPKRTDEERRAREEAVRARNEDATRVPLGVLERCPEVLALAEEMIAKGNRSSVSDAGVAALAAEAGAWGAYYNVLINLQGLGEGTFTAEARARADAALADVRARADRTRAAMLEALRTPGG